MAPKTEIVNFVDHGISVIFREGRPMWKSRRGPWFRENMSRRDDQNFEDYRLGRAKGRHIQVKAGDKVPIRGLDVEVVSAAGKPITEVQYTDRRPMGIKYRVCVRSSEQSG
jgi:hypothetical protein